jgi:ubiquinone/menaquinone biosynthesis C-methylase UbiE
MSGKDVEKIGNSIRAYGDFAYVYDELMDAVPYEKWSEEIIRFMEVYGVSKPGKRAQGILESEKNLVVDLCCGTGILTCLLYDRGYDMIGIDSSGEMLCVAAGKHPEREILYLLQDMRMLELYSTVGTVLSTCDSLNYILDEQELLTVFKLINTYLYPGGLLIFDFNTVYKYEHAIGNGTIAENREKVSFIWENHYDPDTQVNEYELTIFIREGDGRFRRIMENHYQRGYTVGQITRLVKEAGFEIAEVVDGDSWGGITSGSERVFVVAKECLK